MRSERTVGDFGDLEAVAEPGSSGRLQTEKRAVALIGNFLSQSGGSRCVCEELALRLAGAGWSVITSSDKRARVWRLSDMVRTVWTQRNKYAVALVEVYSGHAFIWAEVVSAVLRSIGKPYVLALHGGNLPKFARRHPGRVRRLLRSTQVVTVPSNYLRAEMSAYGGQFQLLPNALDLSRYKYRLRPSPQPLLTWLRSFHEIYNPSLAVRVLANLMEQFAETQLTMVGPDKKDGSLQRAEKLALELGVLKHLHLPGGVAKTEVPGWLDRADIFLNTTNADNTPVSVLEAMACGLPVVSTDVGGLRYLLEHEQDGLLVPPDDTEAMASAVRRLLMKDGLAERLSRNGRSKAEGYDWKRVLPQWEALLSRTACGEGASLAQAA